MPHGKGARKRLRTCFEGPFGEVIRATGPLAKANPFRFSTKYYDDDTDLLYYGYRYYSANTERWISRDPLGEKVGGKNLYGFVSGDPVSRTDTLGLFGDPAFCWVCKCKKVNLGPVGAIEVFTHGEKNDILSIGPSVPRSFETEGLLPPTFCKCKYRDSGHSSISVSVVTPDGRLNVTKLEKDFRTFDRPYIETEIPCKPDVDYPGLKYENYPPDTLLKVELTVDMSVTAICDGTDGSHAEATVSVKYHYKDSFTTPGK